MCGILGIIGRRGLSENELRVSDLARLRHRGPDGEGIVTDRYASLGHTRLAILDPTTAGVQPMQSRSGRFVITFNGEVYNYRELRDHLRGRGHDFRTATDTEVLLAAFEEYGRRCVDHLRGMFAFAIWDRWEKKLFVARDRCGERPFFLWHDAERFVFASELKGLLPLLHSTPQIDPSVVDMYLHFQYVPEPWTLITGVRKLPAAHVLELDVDSWHAEYSRYWSLTESPNIDGPVDAHIAESLDEAVRLQLRADVAVGVALSGGIDSGAIAVLAARHAGPGVHAFSVGYPGRPACDEREQARGLASRLGMHFHEVEIPVADFVDEFPALVDDLDEPLADPAAFAHLALPKAAAAAGIKVLLGGIGGDELFWGYGWMRQVSRMNRLRDMFPWLLDRPWSIGNSSCSYICRKVLKQKRLPPRMRATVESLALALRSQTPAAQPLFMDCAPDFIEAASIIGKEGLFGRAGMPSTPPRYLPTASFSRRTSDHNLQSVCMLFDTWLVSNCLTLGDRMGMSVGVEMRQPLLDHRLIETVVGLHRRHRGWAAGHKPWLKKALRHVLPDDVLDRPKRGFTPPVEEWLKGVVHAYGDNLETGALAHAGIVHPAAARRVADWAASKSWAHLFMAYKLVLLEHWARQIAGVPAVVPVAA